MTAFYDFVQKNSATITELPLVHTTDYLNLPSIVASNQLRPRNCKIFKEPLLYFFYGRPAYRDKDKIEPAEKPDFFPICFVFKPGTLSGIVKRLYPFDTGALHSELYKPQIAKEDLANYFLLAQIEIARKLVTCFFETDKRYLENKPLSHLSFNSNDIDAESYFKLLNGGGSKLCDDRRSAIEIQIPVNVDVSDSLLAIVLPLFFLEDENLKKSILQSWSIEPLTYEATVGMRPLECHGNIREKVKLLYASLGYKV